jgi:hypothetical protein
MIPEWTPSGRTVVAVLDEYRCAVRLEACLCGGIIVAGPSDRAIQLAVRSHQITPRHVHWRTVMENGRW